MEKPLKITICAQKFLLPLSFLQNTFASQYSFFFPNDILLARISPKSLLNLLLQNMLPKISSQENSFQKSCSRFCSPNFHPQEFAPQIFPPKNLLPNIFALYISSHNEILLIKIPPKYFCWRNFLLTRISPPKLGA